MNNKNYLHKTILVLGDLISFIIGLWVSLYIRHLSMPTSIEFERHVLSFVLIFAMWVAINYINGLYDTTKNLQGIKFFRRIWEAAGISLLIGIIFFYLFPQAQISPKTILVLSVFSGYTLSSLFRYLSFKIIFPKTPKKKVLFVGFNQEVKEIISLFEQKYQNQYQAELIIDQNETTNKRGIETKTKINNIEKTIEDKNIDLVILAPHIKSDKDFSEQLYHLLFLPIEIRDTSLFYEDLTGRIPPHTLHESWFLDHLRNLNRPFSAFFRRTMDLIASIFLGFITLVLFPVIALAIKLESKGPVLIKQKRVGKNNEVFNMYKFRSMYALSENGLAETDGPEFAKKDDDRVTKIGKFMRKTRIDELPQVWNMLKGDITLVGPRPERPEIVKKLKEKMPYYSLRHVVKPGLTSWAVLHQNYTDTLEKSLQKLQFDLYYIKNRSFLLDITILMKTVNVLVRMMGQ